MTRRSTVAARLAAAWTALVLVAGGAAACSDHPLLPSPSDGIRVAFGSDVSGWPRSPWRLLEAAVEGDTLALEVQHSGGCRDHDFWLLAVNEWVAVPTAGPVDARGVPLLLAHDDRGDACEAAVVQTLRFDLDPLRRAHRDRFGDRAARLLLRVPVEQGSSEVRVLDWEI